MHSHERWVDWTPPGTIPCSLLPRDASINLPFYSSRLVLNLSYIQLKELLEDMIGIDCCILLGQSYSKNPKSEKLKIQIFWAPTHHIWPCVWIAVKTPALNMLYKITFSLDEHKTWMSFLFTLGFIPKVSYFIYVPISQSLERNLKSKIQNTSGP
jgi:hypothetical protein